MIAEIIAVGTELLIGQIANTNAQFISRKLNEIGAYVYFHQVVGDNVNRLEETFKLAYGRSDLIIITGGLGPTEDDLTKETIAKVLNMPMVTDVNILETIKEYFHSKNRVMVKSNEKQAQIPKGAIALHNDKGTAPGIYIDNNQKKIVLLPGPPIEMQPMFDFFVDKYLNLNQKIFSKFINIFGLGESETENRIKDLIHKDKDITLATYASLGQVTIRITTIAKNDDEGQLKVKDIVNELENRFGELIFSKKESKLNECIFKRLKKEKKTVAFAESCTGGLVSKMITDLDGASSVFKGSIIAYSNEIKESCLKVNHKTLIDYGAVSKQTAEEMATNLRIIMNTDYAVSITGIAGPKGGTIEKPVGLVYIAIASKDNVSYNKFNFNGDRNKVRCLSAMHAFDMLRREILSDYEC